MKNARRRGATTIEMTLVGIPIIFIMISIFEISRGMWMYHTAAHAVRKGVRFATVHGLNCITNAPGVNNNCTVTANDIAAAIKFAGVGLDPATTTVTFTSLNGSFGCPLNGSDNGANCGGVEEDQSSPMPDKSSKNALSAFSPERGRLAISACRAWIFSRTLGSAAMRASSAPTACFTASVRPTPRSRASRRTRVSVSGSRTWKAIFAI